MGYYAAYLDLGGRECLVVGGGVAAAEKAAGLLEAGARVTVTWDEPGADLLRLGAEGAVTLVRRRFQPSDLEGVFLVVDASLEEATGIVVAREGRARGVLVNVLDRPARCDFIAPAMLRRGPLQVAVSTGGRSPFMAAHVRRLLEQTLGAEWGQLVELVGQLRDRLRAEGVPLERQNAVYAQVPGSGALELLGRGDLEGARRAVEACAGAAAVS